MKQKNRAHSCHAVALDGGKPVEGDTQRGPKPQKRKRALRVPVVKESERILGLLPEEVAFIREEIAARTERGWSQERVAREAHVSRSMIQHLEHFRRSLSYRVAVLVSGAFGATAPEFGLKSRRWLDGPPGAEGGQVAAVPV